MQHIRTRYLADVDSLLEYERLWGRHVPVSVEKTVRRTIAAERSYNRDLPDTFYEGLGHNYIRSRYQSFPQLICQMPCDIAKDFLMSCSGKLYVKGELFDEWMDTLVIVPPSLFIAAFYVEQFSVGLLQQPLALYDFVKQTIAPFAHTTMLSPFLPELKYWVGHTNGLNDLHVHLNGSTETDAVWIYMLHHQQETVITYAQAYNKQAGVRKLAEQVMHDFTPEMLQQYLRHAKQLQTDLLSMVAAFVHDSKAGCTKVDQLWKNYSSTSSFGPLIDEILFLMICMATIHKSGNMVFAQKFHHYLLLKGIVHRFLVQQHNQVGFPQFQIITENPFREEVEKNYKHRFLQLMGTESLSPVQLIEGRFSPKESAIRNHQLLDKIEKGFEQAKKTMAMRGSDIVIVNVKLALIAHFIKKPETESTKKAEIRHHTLREELKKKAMALSKTLKTQQGKRLVKGIDAAASELDAGPEVFAPAFRYLSRRGMPHLTYHAGEDYRHLLSGIRAVMEAITFLHMRAGDRIGHGTALGIEPELWFRRVCGKCYLPQGEWLDDLVFAWNLIRVSGKQELHPALPAMESAIAELSSAVYGEQLHPSVLHKTWSMREFEPKMLQGKMEKRIALELYDYEEIQRCEDMMKDSIVARIIQKYHAPSEGSVFSVYRRAYDELIRVDIGNYLSCDQLRLVQNMVLKMLAEKGIVIESLPTSNLRISYYRQMKEYHFERWIDYEHEDTLMPPVVLGSDDPGIFMTNIYNEYARLYCYLGDKSYSSAQRIAVLKQIHENSEIYQFSNYD